MVDQAVGEIRGRGLMIGIELDRPCAELVGQALQEGLLINVTANKVVRLLPPLILSDEDADLLVERLFYRLWPARFRDLPARGGRLQQ